ncbi:MAG: hypothetical protein RL518_2411 [Pseudomonadota bacterium]|jgi:hypothetical protein
MAQGPKKTGDRAANGPTPAQGADTTPSHPPNLKPWEDKTLKPKARLQAYKDFVREKIADILAAANRVSDDPARVIEIRDNPENRHWIKEAEGLRNVTPKDFCKRRDLLGPREKFIAKYNIEVHGPHEVSFELPRGVSRYEMLCEAQESVRVPGRRALVYPNQLKEWEQAPAFKEASTTPHERIRIDGHVADGDGQSRAQQEALLDSRGLRQAKLEDLAAAFVAHYVATGEPLFGWFQNSAWTFVVRAAGGALYFKGDGLRLHFMGDDYSLGNMAVASRVFPA